MCKIIEFIKKYSTYKDDEKLLSRVQKHIEYKTCKILSDDKGVYAVCLWNISSNAEVAEIIDLIIREDYRNTNVMAEILKEGLKIWPVKYLSWNRDYTEDGHDRWKTPKMFPVERFLRRFK